MHFLTKSNKIIGKNFAQNECFFFNYRVIVCWLTIEVIEDDGHSLPLEVVNEFVDGPLEAGLEFEGGVEFTDASLECKMGNLECTGIALDHRRNRDLSWPTEDCSHALIGYLAHCKHSTREH